MVSDRFVKLSEEDIGIIIMGVRQLVIVIKVGKN